ncbi:hypothetical protein OSH11_21565 [Kaistia dalseonensis]|uniref:Uncharacterized protein n=1 Tax=Kaistia dalseonensis TaxID=410840 RepID=A0ABU0HCA3_9HYPH|nr:hypothetical protein [Kaistia dalseonensis]MCX5497300.1 hypothetical protein [Kaistia dalseonensis]MDQ0439937.1 hypothetical protein [Kaistia dalseonensis]
MMQPAPAVPRHSDRSYCDALRAERRELIEQLARHKPRSPRHAVLIVRLQDITARLLEVENRLSATPEFQWKDDDDEHYPDQKSRAAGR